MSLLQIFTKCLHKTRLSITNTAQYLQKTWLSTTRAITNITQYLQSDYKKIQARDLIDNLCIRMSVFVVVYSQIWSRSIAVHWL